MRDWISLEEGERLRGNKFNANNTETLRSQNPVSEFIKNKSYLKTRKR